MKKLILSILFITIILAGCGPVSQNGFFFTLEKIAETESSITLRITMGNTSASIFTVESVTSKICFAGGICRESIPVPLSGEWIIQPGASVMKEMTVPYISAIGSMLGSVQISITGSYENGRQETVTGTHQF